MYRTGLVFGLMWVVWGLSVPPVYSQTLAETPYGTLFYVNGELLNVANVDDPVAYRMRKILPPSGGNGIGKISCDAMRDDGVGEELCLVIFKADERYTTKATEAVGQIDWFLRRPFSSGTNDDARMNRIVTFSWDAIVSQVPIYAPNLTGGYTPSPPQPTTPPAFVRAPGGQTELHMQGDGNLVTYDVRCSPWVPLWSSHQGKLRDFDADKGYCP